MATFAADEPPQPEPAEPLSTAADDVAPADAVMPATSEQESTTASTEPADDAPEPIAAADMFAEEGAPLADAPEDEGKDGNMNRSAQEVKDALMNRSSLNNVNVLVAC